MTTNGATLPTPTDSLYVPGLDVLLKIETFQLTMWQKGHGICLQ